MAPVSLLSVGSFAGFVRGFCHALQVPGDDRRCHGVYRVVDVPCMQVGYFLRAVSFLCRQAQMPCIMACMNQKASSAV